jgi:hypothetical protein
VLDHAYAGNRVEALLTKLPVVGDANVHPLGGSSLGHAAPGRLRLAL